MKTFALALIAVVASADFLPAPVQQVWDSIPVTREQAKAKYGRHGRKFVTNEHHAQHVLEAHHNVRAQRERLGLAPLNSRGDNIRKSYEDMTGFSAYILGIFMGLMYNPAAGPNKCFSAVESGLTASSNLFYILTRSYMPWYLPEAQLVLQDNIALAGGFYTDCDVNKFFDSMTSLISEEGISQMSARATAAYPFEYSKYKKSKEDEFSTSFQRGESFGKLFGAVTNYHI